jgi:hypothetical protein
MDSEIIQAEQQILKDAINNPGVKLLFQKLTAVSESMAAKQLNLDPYSQQAEIKRAQEFRYVVTVLFPQIMEGLVNYQADAPDKQIPKKQRWSFIQWIHALTGQKESSK